MILIDVKIDPVIGKTVFGIMILIGGAIVAILAGGIGLAAPSQEGGGRSGEKVYQENCSVCHGDRGNGKTWVSGTLKPPPRNFTDPEVIKVLGRERMFQSISNGRPGTGMQPFKSRLSPDEIEAVIDYIRTDFMKIDVPAEKKKE